MSYILEALNRSQKNRELGQIPTLAVAPHLSAGGAGRGRNWGVAALVLALIATLIALYGVFGERWTTPPAALQPSAQAPAPAVKEITPPAAAIPSPAPTSQATAVVAADTIPRTPSPPQPDPIQADRSEREHSTQTANTPKENRRTENQPKSEPVVTETQGAEPVPAPISARQPFVTDIEVPPDLLEDVQRFEEQLRREQELAAMEEEEVAAEKTEEPVEDPTEETEEAPPEPAAAATSETEAMTPDLPQTPASSPPRPAAPTIGPTQSTDDIRLTVHVYSATPEQRFVIINSRKMREGERSKEGFLVEKITPEGVQIQHQGQSYFQPR